MWWKIVLVVAVVAGGWYLSAPPRLASDEIVLPAVEPGPGPGLSVDSGPLQEAPEFWLAPIAAGDFKLLPVARFEVEGRVLSRRAYRRGRMSELSPFDLALGWGPMASDEAAEIVRVEQGARFARVSAREPDMPSGMVAQNFANIHIIPAGQQIRDELAGIGPDDSVRLAGYLVDAHAGPEWFWETSRTRSDTGPGACEILLVTHVSQAGGRQGGKSGT